MRPHSPLNCLKRPAIPMVIRGLLAMVLSVATLSTVAAESIAVPKGAVYSLDQQSMDAGGGYSDGANFAIQGSIGQPDADPLQPSTGGGYSVLGGFGAVAQSPVAPLDSILADGFED